MTDGQGGATYHYNSLRQMDWESRTFTGLAGQTFTLNYTYGLSSQLKRANYVTTGGFNKNVNYAYNTVGALYSIGTNLIGTDPNTTTNVLTGAQYNGFGALKTVNYGNNRRLTLGYDASRHQMTSMMVDNQNGTNAIISKAYQYVTNPGYGAPNDNDGRIKKITDNVDSAYTMTYSYDEYNRLYSASAPAFTRSYWYDAWGNLMQIGGNSTTNYTLPTNATGAPATNRMSSVTVNGAPTSYTWDAAGNMTGEGATSFQYDAANRLKRVNNGTGGSYGYDGNSQRVKKVEGSTTLYYVRSSIIGQAVMEISGSAVYRAYVYNGGSMVAMQGSDGQFYWRHSNHLGSGYKLTNTSGVVAYRAEHDPHGNVLFETGSTTLTAHKFTSYERDSSGLDYANARMFSATRARFTKPDPGWKRAAGNAPQSLNRYSYADNDPVNMVDPAGEFPIPFLLPGTLMSLTAIATALDRTVNISAGFYYGPLAVQSILSTLALQQRPVQIPVPNHPTGIPLVVPPPPPFVRLEAAVKNAFDDLFKMFANGISKKCQENVIDKLSNYIPDFNADTFKSYLAGGVTVHNGTHSITPMSQVLTPGALRNFNMSGDQTVGANMASINAAALTVALPGTQTLNVYVDTGILYNSWFSPNGSPSTASLGALMFHEALHGYGATIPVGGENVILDNFLKGALLGGQGDPDNTHDITQYIFENCFQ